MASNIPKDRTVAALGEVWASLSDLLGELSEDEWQLPSPLPGWSVQDNVAHIVGTEAMLAGESGPDVQIDREANAHVRNDIGAFNEQWVESLRAVPPNEVLSRFRELTGMRLAALEQMSDDEWNAESFTPAGKDTYGRFMQIRVFDCWLHEQDIRDAVGRPGHESGVAVDVVLDEMATALGFVVGKKAGATAGQSVTFALTDSGAVVRELNVEVGERAAVVPALSAPATVVLTMPVGVMTRRCAGRVGPDDLLDQVVIDGDLALAAKILENQSYTI
ncbi:MAG: maleylpyruvate isomerase family mycothiol-dependent enzyme [Ilumatobacteraceae bacterium]